MDAGFGGFGAALSALVAAGLALLRRGFFDAAGASPAVPSAFADVARTPLPRASLRPGVSGLLAMDEFPPYYSTIIRASLPMGKAGFSPTAQYRNYSSIAPRRRKGWGNGV
ncbi:hypothetical protein [Paracoccus sp. (in: a-proteobacteria)]|uniref:hypothetical protein n=1 Tax=Paracoccus sp. TaxID=267 RepID=UPI0026E08F87|nr:hypothetical protein [Paracoccus sp. (in: a-proteobacteria)]